MTYKAVPSAIMGGFAAFILTAMPVCGKTIIQEFPPAPAEGGWFSSIKEGNLTVSEGKLHLFKGGSGRKHALRIFDAVELKEGERLLLTFEVSFPKETGSLNHSLRIGLFNLQEEAVNGENRPVYAEGYMAAIGNHNEDTPFLALDLLARSNSARAPLITGGSYERLTLPERQTGSMMAGEVYTVEFSVERQPDSKLALWMKISGGNLNEKVISATVDNSAVSHFNAVALCINGLEGERTGGFPEADFSKIRLEQHHLNP